MLKLGLIKHLIRTQLTATLPAVVAASDMGTSSAGLS